MSAAAETRRSLPNWALLLIAFACGVGLAFASGSLTSIVQPRIEWDWLGAILILSGLIAATAGAAWAVLKFGPALRLLAPSAMPVPANARQLFDVELGKVLAVIRARITSHESYAHSLTGAQERLSALPTAEQVRVIVTLLLAENQRMRLDTENMSKELDASRQRISKLNSSLQEATAIGLRDQLTEIGNRRCFDLELAEALSTAKESRRPVSIIISDIDNFKKVNDAFGHQIGDEVLKYFAQLLKSSVRQQDTVTRFGGEEFAIILPDADVSVATSLAERIREQLNAKNLTIRKTAQEIGRITASFGVAEYQRGETAESLVSRADTSLYEAKKTGRNRVGAS